MAEWGGFGMTQGANGLAELPDGVDAWLENEARQTEDDVLRAEGEHATGETDSLPIDPQAKSA